MCFKLLYIRRRNSCISCHSPQITVHHRQLIRMVAIRKLQFSFSQRFLHIHITRSVRMIVRHPHMPAPQYVITTIISRNHTAATRRARSHPAINAALPLIGNGILSHCLSVRTLDVYNVRMVLSRVDDTHHRLADVPVLFRLPEKFHLNDASPLAPALQGFIRFLCSVTLISQRVEAETSTGSHHKAIARRNRIVIVLRSGHGIDVGHTFVIRRDTRMAKTHRIAVLRIIVQAEIRGRFPADVHTIIQFLFGIRGIHGYKVQKRASLRRVRFRALQIGVCRGRFAAYIGRDPARIRIAFTHIDLYCMKLVQNRGISAIRVCCGNQCIVQRDALQQDLFQFITAHGVVPVHRQSCSQALQQEAGIITALRTLNDSLTVSSRHHVYMFQMEHIRHGVDSVCCRRIDLIDYRSIYIHTLYPLCTFCIFQILTN